MTFQLLLKYHRLRNAYTQQYVASLLNISQSSYSRLETGQTTPTQEHLIAFLKIYNIPIESAVMFIKKNMD